MPPHSASTITKTPYITAEGFAALQAESRDLWVKRREVTAALAAAAAEGDRSENAEYIYRKKQLRELDRRVRYLQKRLPELKVVQTREDDCPRVYFGAWVTLENEDGDTTEYRIVGSDEFDPTRNWISVDAPVSRALLGRQVDDEVSVQTPEGLRSYWVMAVRYR